MVAGKRRAPKAGDGRVGAPPWKQALGASRGSVAPDSGYGRSLTPAKLPDRLDRNSAEGVDTFRRTSDGDDE